MVTYDFKNLSSVDLEELVRDLLQRHLSIHLESFKPGRDQGIDLRYSAGPNTLIVQCKHFSGTGFSGLKSHLQRFEVQKVNLLKPKRYILATSVGLTPQNKDDICQVLHPYCLDSADVLGAEDLNNLIRQFPDVEKAHYKLWLTSTAVLERILHSAICSENEVALEKIKARLCLYVQNASFYRAMQILQKHHYCVISGIPGIGKSTLAEILLVDHIRRKWIPIVISRDIRDAFELFKPDQKQIFYYDDFLGRSALQPSLKKNEDASLKRFSELVRSSGSRLVLTTRDYIL